MPIDPKRLLSLIHEIDQTPREGLRKLDRELLLLVKRQLVALKGDVDRALLRLEFVDELRLN
jgi:hypothetical protein